MTDGLGAGLGLGDAVPGDGRGWARRVVVGAGLVRFGWGWPSCTGLAVGDGEVTAGESAPPGRGTVDAGRTSR